MDVRSTWSVPPEVSCPLCLDLFIDPVTTPCRHSFCRACIARVLISGHTSCPLCRSILLEFRPDVAASAQDILSLIDAVVPHEAVVRRRLEEAETLEVIVGNLYEHVERNDRNVNKWTMYVSLRGTASGHAAALIERVVYKLHPTFRPATVTGLPPDFGLTRFGWGTFAVQCEIHWHRRLAMAPKLVEHLLVFEGTGGRTMASANVSPEGIGHFQQVLQAEPESRARRRGGGGAGVPAGASPRFLPPPRVEDGEAIAVSRSADEQAAAGTILELVVGNRCEVTDGGSYRWTMFVRLPRFQRNIPMMIDKVDYELHPTFVPRSLTRRPPNLELSRVGWGTFPVKVTVHWRACLGIRATELHHELDFSEGGGCTAVTVGVSARRLQQFR